MEPRQAARTQRAEPSQTMPVHIDNRHPLLRVDRKALAAYLRSCLRQLARPRAVVDVSLVDDAEIRELNATWRKVDAVTDVLSFALEDSESPDVPIELLGDVVISLDTAQRQAQAMQAQVAPQAYGLLEETAFLATHGLLHLLGYDHQTEEGAAEMEALERQLIAVATRVDVHGLDRTEHGLPA